MELLDRAKSYWFCQKADSTNQKIIKVDTALFKTVFYLERGDVFMKPEITVDDVKKCFRKPRNYTGEIDWDQIKKDAVEIFDQIC